MNNGDTPFVFRIARIRRALRREFDARAESFDITAAQFIVLHRLWREDGILISTLTRDVCSDGGTITGLLDRLETKELIRRERCREDRRVIRVFLTDAGRDLEAPLMAIITAVGEQALEGFSPQERRQLMQALERVEGNLGIAERF